MLIINMYLYFKRFFDIVSSFIGMILLIPISIIVKLIYVSVGDGGKILYRQSRIGKDGKVFQIYKFRTMVRDADEILGELLKEDSYKQEWEANQKIEDDPRITKFGRFLREFSIDELPQFINVFIGDMSIVGPRPLVEGELEAHDGKPDLYWGVKPGITGWWACHGRSNLDYQQRLELEYYYVQNCSLKLDMLCILKTLIAVFKRSGAK